MHDFFSFGSASTTKIISFEQQKSKGSLHPSLIYFFVDSKFIIFMSSTRSLSPPDMQIRVMLSERIYSLSTLLLSPHNFSTTAFVSTLSTKKLLTTFKSTLVTIFYELGVNSNKSFIYYKTG